MRASKVLLGWVALICAALPLGSATATAATTSPEQLVSAVPASTTPQVRDGHVYAVEQVGQTMVAGGDFASVSQTPTATALPSTGAMAFDAVTGALSTGFRPELDGLVNAVLAGPSAGTVYLGGDFSHAGGLAVHGLVLVSVATGQPVPGFAPPVLDGQVRDLAVTHGHLVVGGTFRTANGSPRWGLASFSPATGAMDAWLRVGLQGHHNYDGTGAYGAVGVRGFDVSADGQRLVVVGNFTVVGDQPRDQVAVLWLTDATVSVGAWYSNAFSYACSRMIWDSWVRDVQFSPDASYFVVVSMGGGATGTTCDAAARMNVASTGAAVRPSWVASTGGDSLLSVAISGSVVYAGGHERWLNNPYGHNDAQPGAVPRPGLVALDAATGIPYSWNPGRNPRGFGTTALLRTSAGLWVGSDTEWIGNYTYHRDRLAFFPSGGAVVPQVGPWSLPAELYRGGPLATGGDELDRYHQTSDGITHTAAIASSGVDWSQARGAFVAGPWLYFGSADGTLHRRTFDGQQFGPVSSVDPYNDPLWSTVTWVSQKSSGTYRGMWPGLYGSELAAVTGMFYDAGRVYYTVGGSTALYYRRFNTESGIVGAARYSVAGVTMPSTVAGMYLAGAQLYYANGAGALTRVDFRSGVPVMSTATLVGGPATDGVDYRARALFVGPAGP